MRIDVHIHNGGDEAALARIERKLDEIMTTEADILALLQTANDETNQIGIELQALLDRPDVTIPQSVRDAATALVARLTAVAAETPTPPSA